MMKNLHEFAPIITDDDILWLVHGIVDGKLLCRPKYLDFWNLPVRLHSPVFCCEQIQTRFLPYDRSGVYAGLYLIGMEDVTEQRIFTDHIPLNCETARKACSFLESMRSRGLPSDDTGVIGSLLWGRAIDGFSDINLAIRGDQTYQHYMEICLRLPDIHFRNEEAWRDFYHRYSVTGVSEDRFVKLSNSNFQQGMISNIPFSLFHIRQKLPEYDTMHENSRYAELVGEFISKDASQGYFPILGHFHTNGQTLTAVIWSRFWMPILPRHAILRIRGYINGSQFIVSGNNDIEVLEVLCNEDISSPSCFDPKTQNCNLH